MGLQPTEIGQSITLSGSYLINGFRSLQMHELSIYGHREAFIYRPFTVWRFALFVQSVKFSYL